MNPAPETAPAIPVSEEHAARVLAAAEKALAESETALKSARCEVSPLMKALSDATTAVSNVIRLAKDAGDVRLRKIANDAFRKLYAIEKADASLVQARQMGRAWYAAYNARAAAHSALEAIQSSTGGAK